MSTPLKELCELIVDCPHFTAPDEGSGYPLIRTPDIGLGFLDLSNVHRVSEEVYSSRNVRATPQPMDLILAREAPAGNVGIIRRGQHVCLGQRTVLIRPNQEKVDPWYLNYYLNAPQQRHELLSNANGATVSHVNMPVIRNLPVSLPGLREQRVIASVLRAYDDLIENNRKQIRLLEEAMQRLYWEWFIDFNFPGHEDVEIVDGVPEGWGRVPFFDVVEITRGRSYKRDEIHGCDRILVNLGNMASFGGWRFGKEKPYSGVFKQEQIVKAGDLVMAITEQSKERRLVGYVAIVPNYSQETVFSMDLIKLTPKSIDKWFLYSHLRFSGLSREISFLANGTNILHLKPDALDSVRILMPLRRIQDAFSKFISPLVLKRWVLEKQIFKAQEARNRLLPKLMSDESEVYL